ncbi:MAG: 2-oxoacid:acceptor oxidoreductase subunit alpha [Chloroflexi bacterium]|nr:2-oxoacid:acceptor oxidoreductase subunit alpha [Chloroflexota bacterium]
MAKESGDVREVDRVTIRFAGDSGDGSQLAGQQFTNTAAIFGNDVSTVPDYPAEIRAPAGSLPGVSSFQVSFSSHEIYTAGDNPDVLVAMNPAALKTNLPDVPKGSLIIINADEFTEANFRKADYEADPREDGTLAGFRLIQVPITSMNARALKESGLPQRQIDRSKNLFALGVMFWLYERSLEPTLNWIDGKFAKNPQVAEANKTTLKAGFYFGETAELFSEHYRVPKANPRPGKYRNITGNEATALGFLAASQLLKKPLFYASYPITPASDILGELAKYKSFGVKTMQTEDELAAIGAAIGASFGGALGLTGTSGPGLALKSEAIGLAVMTELPVVIANVQRSGPSTGMPSKTEQGDLLQAMFGRNGESPLAIVAPATPAECFEMAIEAFRIATKFMVPTIFLSDGLLGSGSEPWRIPAIEDLPKMEVQHPTDPETFEPYQRDETTLARPWAIPGTPGLEHRIGGLEKSDITGNVRYDAENHERMTRLRAEKVERIADDIPELKVDGEPSGELLVLGWGSTYGAIITAVYRAQADGLSVSAAHLRYLNPFPRNLGDVLSQFERVLIPEMNLGQLLLLIRARYLVDAEGLNRVTGRPMKTADVAAKIETLVRRKVSVA